MTTFGSCLSCEELSLTHVEEAIEVIHQLGTMIRASGSDVLAALRG